MAILCDNMKDDINNIIFNISGSLSNLLQNIHKVLFDSEKRSKFNLVILELMKCYTIATDILNGLDNPENIEDSSKRWIRIEKLFSSIGILKKEVDGLLSMMNTQ